MESLPSRPGSVDVPGLEACARCQPPAIRGRRRPRQRWPARRPRRRRGESCGPAATIGRSAAGRAGKRRPGPPCVAFGSAGHATARCRHRAVGAGRAGRLPIIPEVEEEITDTASLLDSLSFDDEDILVTSVHDEISTTNDSVENKSDSDIESINIVAQESAQGVEQIARASEDLNRLTESLQNLVNNFKLDNSSNQQYLKKHEEYETKRLK